MAERMKRVVLASRPKGEPVPEDFRLEEDAVPSCPEGGILVRVLWQSLDPYMRGRMDESKSYAKSVPVGGTMEAGCVAEVIESRTDRFREGDIVEGRFGWCTHAASEAEGVRKVDPSLAPIQTAIGVLGMPGLTAYVGLLDHGRPKEGETLVVGAATGAVGSVVGQLGKIKGMRVVGVAGGPTNAPGRRTSWGSTPASTTAPPATPMRCAKSSPPPARMASTSISRTSAARRWTP